MSEVVSGALAQHRSVQSLSQSLKIDSGTVRYILSFGSVNIKRDGYCNLKQTRGGDHILG